MNKKKRGSLPLCALCMLIAVTALAVIPTEAEAAIYDDTLRVHILASSDSDADQALKIELRDKILEKYSSSLVGSSSLDEAISRTEARLPEIISDVNAWIVEAGFSYTARGEVVREWYGRREYQDFALPAGYYASLKITLGEGAGKNWWCVMFPPMCLDIATDSTKEDAGQYTESEERLIGGKYKIKFKLLELAAEAVGQLSKRG